MSSLNTEYLQSIGKLWKKKDLPKDIVTSKIIDDIVESISSLITNEDPKSVIISGNKGVGKSTLIDLISSCLKSKGWVIFTASAANMMAGQRYIGDLEQNIKKIVNELSVSKKTLWIVPRFHELYYGGRHEFSPVSILDQLLPYIESGELRILSEDSDDHLQKVIQFRPQVQSVFEIVRISVASKNFTMELAKEWMNKEVNQSLWKCISSQDLQEVFYLSSQYLAYKEQPGSILDLLKHAQKIQLSKGNSEPIRLRNIIESLSSLTGLPENILDDGEKLELSEVEEYFTKKVIGQEDAVQTITERIAMIKAGLTDPSKPAGVFLFVGPTGTGKTEIAKALATYLFGSEERLIRLDMSEFQTGDSMPKILGDASDVSESSALVNSIRRKPFSVILLDEFEKAHANIWDLFLQVFDDGRLTDQRGATADFRHSIIILTSNLGASVPASARIGFGNPTSDSEIDASAMKTINQTFRPEFINRLDKIVVFNPLTKSVAKLILKSELLKILKRRGLRRRGWELDFEDSALDFLLQKGFSNTLGARPLKRAIEKYLLAPLAKTIVNHSFPEGDQFLLVEATREKLKVNFIDPDEPNINWEQKQQIVKDQESKIDLLSLNTIILEPNGILSEFKLIEKELDNLNQLFNSLQLDELKSELMKKMSDSSFWDSEDRFEALSKVEFIDSIEGAFETADNLFNRLNDPGKERLSYDANLIKRIAERIWLLNQSLTSFSNSIPQDSFLMIQYNESNSINGKKILDMYEGWAKKRGMNFEKILQSKEANEISCFYSVFGFGAYSILEKECGYHIFEEHDGSKKAKKSKVKVVAVPMLLEDYRAKTFEQQLKRFSEHSSHKNSRRYILKKSPLIKDVRNSWQTGNINRVLSGDFDLLSS